MGVRALLTQCLPGLVANDRGSQSISSFSERDIQFPSPAVEIIPFKESQPYKYAGDNIELQGLNLFKGMGSIPDLMGYASSESLSAKQDGFSKSSDSSVDLVNVLKHEIRDGQLSFRGKRVLELSCSYGLPGTFACIKGASVVHFQDLNAENMRCTTIPSVVSNLEQVREWQIRQPESPLTPSRQALTPDVHFYAGDWDELPSILSISRGDGPEDMPRMSLCLSDEDLTDGGCSQDGSAVGRDLSRRSRKHSGSRAWAQADENHGGDGYDIILITEIPYAPSSLKKLYSLIKKCVKPPYGVLYVAVMKKNYVGFNCGARPLRSLTEEEGIFGVHIVKEIGDREVLKFFLR